MDWSEIEAARPLGKLKYFWERGFGARVSPGGQVSWLVQRWEGGKSGKATRKVLGHYPVMTLEQAREIAKNGIPTTLVDAINKYLDIRTRPGRFWAELRPRLERVVRELGETRAPSSISRGELRRLLEGVAHVHPVAARTLYEALRPFWKWMVEQELVPTSPFNDMSPPPAPKARERALSPEEIRIVWACFEDLGYPWGPFFRMLLLTGQRRQEVAGMTWFEIDENTRLWTIPKERTKNGRTHYLPLVMQARDLLCELRARYDITSKGYVFTTTDRTPVSGFARAKQIIDRRCPGVTNWRIHDLRRTVATEMAGAGVPDHIVERVLNHTIPGVRGVYNRYSYMKEKTAALETYSRHLESILRPQICDSGGF
jgi:integrase